MTAANIFRRACCAARRVYSRRIRDIPVGLLTPIRPAGVECCPRCVSVGPSVDSTEGSEILARTRMYANERKNVNTQEISLS